MQHGTWNLEADDQANGWRFSVYQADHDADHQADHQSSWRIRARRKGQLHEVSSVLEVLEVGPGCLCVAVRCQADTLCRLCCRLWCAHGAAAARGGLILGCAVFMLFCCVRCHFAFVLLSCCSAEESALRSCSCVVEGRHQVTRLRRCFALASLHVKSTATACCAV